MIQIESIRPVVSWAGRDDGFVIEAPVKSERNLAAFKEAIGADGHMEIDGTVYRIKGIEAAEVQEDA